MAKLPPIELLEATHAFHALIFSKLSGKPTSGFEKRVLARSSRGARTRRKPATPDACLSRRETCRREVFEILAKNAQQIHLVYNALLKLDGLTLLL